MTVQSKSWRGQIKVHPACDLFPLMTADELKALGEDIKQNGLHTNIAVWQAAKGHPWFLVDGRNRLDAAELVGLSVEFIKRFDVTVKIGGHLDAVDDLSLLDPYEYVISANVHRRHLTPEQKREVIAKALKAQPEKSNREIARQVKDDHHKVGSVRRKLEATGEVSPVEKTTGADGKARTTAPKKKRRHIEDHLAETTARAAVTNADAPAPARQQADPDDLISQFTAEVRSGGLDLAKQIEPTQRPRLIERLREVTDEIEIEVERWAKEARPSWQPDIPEFLRRT